MFKKGKLPNRPIQKSRSEYICHYKVSVHINFMPNAAMQCKYNFALLHELKIF